MIKKEKSSPEKPTQNESSQAGGIGFGLSIGLSLGVLVGIVMDNIGLGMSIGVSVGLCAGLAIGMLKKNKTTGNQKSDEKK